MDTYGQIEIETLLERGESNVAVVFELSNMIVSWKNLIEHTLADVSALGQTNIYKNSLPGSTIEKALLTLRSFFISYLQDFASLHKELTENILQQVQKVNKDHQKQHESHASTIKKSTDLCNSSLLKLNDTKKKFQKSKIDFEKSKERYKSSEIEYQTIIKKSHEEDSTSNNITNPPIEILNNDSTPQTTHASSSSQSMSRLLAKRINNAYESNAKGALDRAQEVCLHKYNTMLQSLEEVKEAKQRYMELFQEHESIIDQTRSKMESFDRDHIHSIKDSLSKFAAIEKSIAEKRVEAAIFLGEAASQIDYKSERDLLIQNYKVPDRTHKCARAMSLLDWDNRRRHVGVTDYERVDQIRSFETYMDQSSWYSHFEAELPSLPFAAPTDHSTNAQDTDNEYIVRDISQDANDVSEEVNGDTLSRPSETVTKYSSYSFLSTDLSGYFFGSKSRSNSTRVHRSDTVASSSSAASVTSSSSSGGVGGDESAVVGSKGTVTGSGLKVPVRSPLTTAGSFRLFASPDATVRDLSSTQYQQTINSSIIHTTPFSNSPPLSPESNRRLNDTVRAIFPSDLSTGNTANNSNKSTDSNKSMSSGVQIDPSVLLDLDAWLLLMAQKPARAYFIARLDERRSSNATLTSTQYEYLLCALHACLDLCQAQDDVQIAMRVANMANTFHVTRDVQDEATGIKENKRVYLQQHPMLCGHEIWSQEGFWDSSLLSGLAQELDRRPPVVWDELPPSEFRDVVVSVHNIIFGQLGALTFNMKEVGLSFDEIERKILILSSSTQIGEEQKLELLQNVRRVFSLPENYISDTGVITKLNS